MSEQSIHPPLDNINVRRPPPPAPPQWRNWLWPIMILAIFMLWIFLPSHSNRGPISLSYSQFITQVNTHQIKTVTFGNSVNRSTTTATGELRNGTSYTTVIPGQPTTALKQKLTADGVNVRIIRTWILGSVLLSLAIFLVPLLFMFLLLRLRSATRASLSPVFRAIAEYLDR